MSYEKINAELGSCHLLIKITLVWACWTKMEFISMCMALRVFLITFAIAWMLDWTKPARVQETIQKKKNLQYQKSKKKKNTEKPVNPTVDDNKSLSESNSAEERAEDDVLPSVAAHGLPNAKNVAIGALNVNSLRKKIGAVQELITNDIDISLRSKLIKIFQTNNLT